MNAEETTRATTADRAKRHKAYPMSYQDIAKDSTLKISYVERSIHGQVARVQRFDFVPPPLDATPRLASTQTTCSAGQRSAAAPVIGST